MNAIEQFISWFRGLGGKVPDNFEEVLNTRYIYDPEPVSSFKDRAEYIKRKYNHRFRFKTPKPTPDDFLKDFPDTNRMIFIQL